MNPTDSISQGRSRKQHLVEQESFKDLRRGVLCGMELLSELSLLRPLMQSIDVSQKRQLSVENTCWGVSDFQQLVIIKNTSCSVAVRSHSCVTSWSSYPPENISVSAKFVFYWCGMMSLHLEVWLGQLWIDTIQRFSAIYAETCGKHTHPAPYVAWGSFWAFPPLVLSCSFPINLRFFLFPSSFKSLTSATVPPHFTLNSAYAHAPLSQKAQVSYL